MQAPKRPRRGHVPAELPPSPAFRPPHLGEGTASWNVAAEAAAPSPTGVNSSGSDSSPGTLPLTWVPHRARAPSFPAPGSHRLGVPQLPYRGLRTGLSETSARMPRPCGAACWVSGDPLCLQSRRGVLAKAQASGVGCWAPVPAAPAAGGVTSAITQPVGQRSARVVRGSQNPQRVSWWLKSDVMTP